MLLRVGGVLAVLRGVSIGEELDEQQQAHLLGLAEARRIKAAVPDAVVVSSGWSYLQDWLPHVAQATVRAGWFDAVGLGRMALSYPDLPADALAGRPLDRKRICRTFSDCTTAPRQGRVSGCYPLDPFYRARRS